MTSGEARALVVTDVFPPDIGGSGELLRNVYGRMRHVPVTVLAHGDPGRTNGDEHLEVIRVASRTTHWGVLNPAGLLPHLRRAVRLRRFCAEAPTVIHCGRALPEGFGAWLACRSGRARYVCWTHGEELTDTASSRELQALLATAQRHADYLIANSHHTAGLLEGRGFDPDRIRIVHPGVDADRFRPDPPGRDALRARFAAPDEVLLLTVGRLQRRKGHDLVLQALARLSAEVRGSLRYVIAGDGQERETLTRMAAALGVSDRVTFLGAVPGDDLPACFASADVFVHPNRVDGGDFEGFGIVFLEAAAAGVPVIAGRSGGVPEAVADGETGVLVSGTDPDELGRAITELATNDARRQAMGRAGRERARSTFTWQRAADQVEAIHHDVAARLGRRRDGS